ncbi:hypothetical protein [Oxalobacter formigenes]|nr:hypothetical protein [Oxalobacter formigenes]WAW01210.1 hypothetical protein NB644_09705 [Oxalobacter formigenes]WAW03539.1 hypothetical protein NB642_10480 [Oxalobacter formigenes]WAW06042.1 hypothetical protein NB639_01170 [Oxalobacter formigenes]
MMACNITKRDGMTIFICGSELPQWEVCAECGDVADILCDYPVGDGLTCDRNLCADCAVEVAPNLHYCKPHFEMWKQFKESGGVRDVLQNVVPFSRLDRP